MALFLTAVSSTQFHSVGAALRHRPPPHPHALRPDVQLWAAPYREPGLFSRRRQLQRAHREVSPSPPSPVGEEQRFPAACWRFPLNPRLPSQDDLPGRHLPHAGLDDVEIHQLPVEKVEGAQSEPGHEEESGQSKEQAPQTGSDEG